MLLLGIQKIKHSAKESFSHSISGTDLIVGPRSGDIQLVLYTVFRQGQPVANISWESITDIRTFSEIEWLIPLSLGDSHNGYPVLGTSTDYFKYYRYGQNQPLTLQTGTMFNAPSDVVLGSDIAKKLNYHINDVLYLSHGVAKGHLPLHKNIPFTVVGILKPTGTPVDKTLHIPLEGITALHRNISHENTHDDHNHIHNNHEHTDNTNTDLTPDSVTACFIGLKSKFSIFSVQTRITNWKNEPLMAIIPGVALSRLWNSMSTINTAFSLITILVTLITFIELLLALILSLQQRKRELSILRTMGAHPSQLCIMLMLESLLITSSGVLLGLCLMTTTGYILHPLLEEKMGLVLSIHTFTPTEVSLALGIIVCGVLTSSIPAFLAYRHELSEGFSSL